MLSELNNLLSLGLEEISKVHIRTAAISTFLVINAIFA
jgi:hypothetical protein